MFFFFIFVGQKNVLCQQYYDYGFEKDYSIQVIDSLGDIHKNPWVGGMNSCHFSMVDFNLDGVDDLFVFDKDGNKVHCYINNGTAGNINFSYAPEYVKLIPEINGWAIFVDYNCDGKKDIFTYTIGGIIVYRNVSVTQLKFEKAVDKYLLSYQFGGYTNIWVTYADYPSFSDIDNDGDIDILTFGVLGSWLGYHKNLSMEKYGNCDSLDYVLDEYSWGCFAESEESNVITLDTCYDSKRAESKTSFSNLKKGEVKHVGSTLLAIDLDADNDKDLIFGDVDYPNVIQLINGGNSDSAYMISQDTMFPSYNVPVFLFSFPALCYLDVDNDNINELIISPFDPALDKSANYQNIWFYENNGMNNMPDFSFQKNDFLQGEMIDVGAGAYPVLFDYDSDGLPDLLVSNFGYLDSTYYDNSLALQCVYRSQIALFRNTGSATTPSFKIITRDFVSVSSLKIQGAYPAFADLDDDGDEDMLLGNNEGTLHYFENVGGAGNEADFVLSEMNFQGIDVGYYSTPQLVDLNKDGLIDIVCGKRNGKLSYFRNTGTASNPVFTKITDELGGVDVSDNQNPYHAYSVPCFFKENNEFRLFVGSVSGHLHYYKDIDDNLDGDFTLDNDNYLWIYEGLRSSVAISDLDDDGYKDMIMGNYSGGLGYYKGVDPPLIGIIENNFDDGIDVFPNPADNAIVISNETGTKIEEIIIYNSYGQVVLRKNEFENIIDISILSTGVYFVCLVSHEFKITKKLVVVFSQ